MSSSLSGRAVRRMPWQQLTILVLVRLGEPIAYASVLPYLPEMVLSFKGVKPADVGFWTGTAAAIFSLAEFVTAIPWGLLSDRIGRKPVLLIGLLCTMLTSLLWGFANSLTTALFIRSLSGACNGNVGIVRTMVAELCPWKELQPRAFSIMPVVYTIGTVIGPAIGGTMANPLRRPPGDKTDGPFLWRFPYALPNMVTAGFFLGGIAIGILFLKETLAAKKGEQDWGIMLGQQLVDFSNNFMTRLKHRIRGEPLYTPLPTSSGFDEPRKPRNIPNKANEWDSVKEPPRSYRSILTKQTVLFLTSYTLLATHTAGFDQVVPVLLHHPRNGGIASDVTILPFRFNRGFGLETSKIGLMFSVNGVVSIIVQFFIFPLVARLFGTLNLLRIILAVQPIFYIAAPYIALIPNPIIAEIAFVILWTVRSGSVIMAFPCSIILVTNSTTSLKVLGTVNGIATATNAMGRAFGPTVAGVLFTWGVRNDRIVAPFMFLAILSLLNLAPLFWAVEGEGFGDDASDTVVGESEEQEAAHEEDEYAVRMENYSAQEKA